MIGRTISDFQITEKIGEGDKGTVYKALDLNTQDREHFVVLKIFHRLYTDHQSKEQVKQAFQEVSTLSHKNIYPIQNIAETDDNTLMVAMPFFDGMTLSKRIEGGPLRIRTAVAVALKIAQTLSDARKQNIHHLNLKSSNVFITTKGEIKIMDFGLIRPQVGENKLQNGKAALSVAYLSPEQFEGKSGDHRSDIWSSAIIFYEMLTGQLPFYGEDQFELTESIIRRSPQPIINLHSESPEKVQRFLKERWPRILNTASKAWLNLQAI